MSTRAEFEAATASRGDLIVRPRPSRSVVSSTVPRGHLILFLATLVSLQPPFVMGAFGVVVSGAGPVGQRGVICAFFSATALGAVLAPLRRAASPSTAIITAPWVAAVSVLVMTAAPGIAAVAAILAVAGLGNAALVSGTIAVVDYNAGNAAASGLARLSAAALGAPLVVGVGVAVSEAVHLSPTTSLLGYAAAMAVAAVVVTRERSGIRSEPVHDCVHGMPHDPPSDDDRRRWVLLSLGALVAALSSNALAVFFVPYATHSGLSRASAGLGLAIASCIGVAARLWMGQHPDRTQAASRHVSTLIAVGALGIALLAYPASLAAVLAVPLVGIGAWGWMGLLYVATRHAGRPRVAGARIQTANFAAAAVAPLLTAAAAASVGETWLLAAMFASSLLVAGLMWRPLTALPTG